MSNNNEQNGRQPPLPQQTVPSTTAPMATAVIHKNTKSLVPTDPRIRNANVTPTEQQTKKCRDFVWGICTKGAQCKFRHELDVESMKDILKFCHDFQNRTGCTRPDCTYLHTSREEENLFLTTGQIPRALAERYAAMSTAQMNLYVSEYLVQAPPPPPPPPPPPSSAAPPPPLPAPLPALLAPPPPPPPPPPPTTTTAPVRMTPPTFSAPPPFNTPTMFSVTQPPPPLPPMFDASRPPPPFPTNATPNKNGALKRAAGPSEAGPSKARKAECSKVVEIETVCENCIQRELRSELYHQELQKLECESEYQSYIYEKKSAENANGRLLLKSTVSPELFRILDEYTEESSQQMQVQDLLSQFNQTPSFDSETSTVPRQFLLQLMGCVLKQRPLIEPTPVPSVGIDESSLLHSLTALTRRANPISHTSSDVIQAVLEVIRNSSSLTSDRNQGNESRTKEATNLDRSRPSTSNISSNAVNGFGHFVNGHKVESAPPAAVASSSRYPTTTNVAARTYSSGTASTASLTQSAAHTPTALHLPNASHPPGAPRPPSTHPPSGLHPANATHPLSVRAVAAPAAYMSYQPAVPPPASRGYYSQPYPSTSNHVPNIHQSYPNSPARMAVTPQVPTRPSTSAPAPPVQNAQNYNAYAMGRYPPQPHNYPPFP